MMSSYFDEVRMVKKLTKNDEPSPVKALVAAFLHENEEVLVTMETITLFMLCLML